MNQPRPNRLKAMVRLLRPYQYLKNLLLFAPAFFALKLSDPQIAGRLVLAFVCFCATTGAVYVFNDWIDRDRDRMHPEKRDRPLASGLVSSREALALAVLCLLVGLGGSLTISLPAAGHVALYLIINLAYSLKIKQIPILDVFVIAIGFVIRLFLGGVVANVTPSMWLTLMTFLLALFLALSKRRNDVVLYQTQGVRAREVVDGYNRTFLDAAMVTMAAVVLVCYINYTISPVVVARMGSDRIYFSTFFVLLGMLRYMQLCFTQNQGGNPTRVLIQDRLLQLTIVLWLGFFGLILYQR